MELNIIWFILIGILFIGFVVLDGFDLGVGMMHLTAKSDEERRILINSIGPIWDGNEVWLITAGGALFAAFPDVYATVFSGFYTAFMLFLTCLIGRIASIEFRSKVESSSWRHFWDYCFSVSSFLIVLLLGVTLGNIVTGVPIAADKEFAGSFFGILQPYAVFLALAAIVIIRLHGSLYIILKTEGELQKKFLQGIKSQNFIALAFFFLLSILTIIMNPQSLNNYNAFPLWYVLPVLVVFIYLIIPSMVNKHKYILSFILSCLIIALLLSMVGVSIYPNLLVSNPIPENSLTIFNASSSQKTLYTMFIIACIGVPLVLFYQIIVYRIFRGKVKLDSSSY